tara:strand:- start:752 stop:1228 length:477 start_codon:yes stop_codon:yes gene_type:complete
MAKFIFTNNVQVTNFVRAGLEADINLLNIDISSNANIVKDVADADYEAALNGTKVWSVSDGEVTFSDQVTNLAGETVLSINDSTADVTKEHFKGSVNHFIESLEHKLLDLPTNHSNLNRVKDTVAFLKAIDFDSLTYPIVGIDKYLNDNNKYINYQLA